MKSPALAFAVGLVALSITFLLADEGDRTQPSAKPKKPDVKALMAAAHQGTGKGEQKQPSPLSIVEEQVASAAPDWTLLAKNLAPMSRLADAIENTEFGYRAPGSSYAEPVAQLVAATRTKDHAKAKSAMTAIRKSCAGCHRN